MIYYNYSWSESNWSTSVLSRRGVLLFPLLVVRLFELLLVLLFILLDEFGLTDLLESKLIDWIESPKLKSIDLPSFDLKIKNLENYTWNQKKKIWIQVTLLYESIKSLNSMKSSKVCKISKISPSISFDRVLKKI